MNKKYITGTGDNFGFEDTDLTPFKKYIIDNNIDLVQLPELNSLVRGTLIAMTGKYYIFSTDFKSDIMVENSGLETELLSTLSKGDSIEILVKNIFDTKKETCMYGTVSDVQTFKLSKWSNMILQSLYDKNETLTGVPVSYDVFNYDVMVTLMGDEQEFDIIIKMPHLLTDINKLPNQDSIIGQEIEFKLVKTNTDEFIASRKAYLQTLAKKELKDLKVGSVYTGHVTGTTSFAIYLQIGNLTGMVHISNLDDECAKLLKDNQILPGQEIEVYLKEVIGTKLVLTRVLRESLWDNIKVGKTYNGKVLTTKKFETGFGVLVELDYDTKGMIYSSSLDDSAKITDFETGQELKVMVQKVIKNKRQISLIIQ